MTLTVLVNAGPWVRVPPSGYGGIEAVVATLVPELRALGVRVVLASVEGSTLEVDDLITPLREPRLSDIARPYNAVSGIAHAHMQGVVDHLRRTPDVDLVHDHLEVVGPAILAAMGRAAPPTLQTLHWDMAKHPDFYGSFDGGGRVAFAAVSQSQLERAPQAVRSQTLGVVPLAAPMVDPLPDVEAGDHALVLARITADKGQDIAARVCRRAGIPLVIAGPVAGVDDPAELRRLLASDPSLAQHPDVRFFTEQVESLIDGDTVRWVGGVQGEAKERLLQSARVLLATNRWAEPGATGVVEALGRGVPVVATPLGVLPSLVRHGVTGYLADSEDALVEALLKLDDLDRTACRAAGAAWTPRDMAQAYVSLYDQLLANSSSRPLAAAP